jgi:hypothetical protein
VDSVEALELRALKASEANKALRTQQEAEAGSKLGFSGPRNPKDVVGDIMDIYIIIYIYMDI